MSGEGAKLIGKFLIGCGLGFLVMTPLSTSAWAQSDGVIVTVAGTGTEGYNGNGGPATSLQISYPEGVAVDSLGNLYVADTKNSRILKVAPDGVARTIAGTGTSGCSGDGGPANLAQLDHPTGVAVDSAGNLYIADFRNSRVRKVATDGLITTVAGGGTDGLGHSGPATSAELTLPNCVAVDWEGNLYIADGYWMPGWINPNIGVRVDALTHHIHKVTPDGLISVVAGGATDGLGDGDLATLAQLSMPTGVAVDSSGNLYIAEADGHRVRKVTPEGVIQTVAGNGTVGYGGDDGAATSAQLNSPTGVAVDSAGNLYIADAGNDRVRKVAVDGLITTIAGQGVGGYDGDGVPATSAQLFGPYDVAVDLAGN